MREIQDMTLNVTRGLERLDKKLRERAARFEREFERLTSPDDAYGIRITALPVGDDVRLPTICRPYFKLVEGLNTPKVTVKRRPSGNCHPYAWRTVPPDTRWNNPPDRGW